MNAPTLVVLAIVIAVFAVIVVSHIRNKKKGESTCSCGCSGCPSAGMCHPESNQ